MSNPLKALRKVFATKKLLFICILFTIGAIANLYSTVSDSPDLTKFTIPVIEYEVNLLEIVGEDLAGFLKTATTVILIINIIGILPQLLTAVALWLIRLGKNDTDGASKRACLGLSFIKIQSFFKILSTVFYAIGVGIVAALALFAGSRIDQSGKSVGIILAISALVMGYFVLVISYHSKLMTMMITVTNTLRTGKNYVKRFALVTFLNWFFAIYYIIAGIRGTIADFIFGLCLGLVYLFMTFLFSNFRDACGWADVNEVREYGKILSNDPRRRETAEVLGYEAIQTPDGEKFLPTLKGLITKQFFGISLSSTRRSEADGSLDYLPCPDIDKTSPASSATAPTRVDFTTAEKLTPSVLPLFKDGVSERFIACGASDAESAEAEKLIKLASATIYRDSISDSLVLRLELTNLSPVSTNGVRISFKAEDKDARALGFAENVLIQGDKSAKTGEIMLSELGVTLPSGTEKITVSIDSLLFADGLSKDGVAVSFSVATPERLERDKREALDADKRESERIKNILIKCENDLKTISAELELADKEVDTPLAVTLGLVDPFKKLLSRLSNIEDELIALNDNAEAKVIQAKCAELRDKYTEISIKAAPKRKKRLAVSICSLSVVVAIITAVLVPTVIIPAERLKRAIAMKEDGKLVESYYALKEIDSDKATEEIKKLREEIEYFVLPESVTVIDDFEFRDFSVLKEVYLHANVTSIGVGAFERCLAIEKISLPNGDTQLSSIFGASVSDVDTFAPSLTSVTFLGGKTICNNALSGFNKVTEIILPDGLERIESSAFENCSSLKSLVIPESVTFYSSNILNGCTSLTELTIPESLPAPENESQTPLFNLPIDKENSSLKKVTVTRATVLYDYAFRGLEKLEEVILPEGLIEIGRESFENCTSLKSIKMPTTLEKVGYYAFNGASLEKVIVVPEKWASVEVEGAYTGLPRALYIESENGIKPLTELTLPEGVIKIGAFAFTNCKDLKSVKIPDSVTQIGEGAFQNCSSLQSITIGNGVESIGSFAFYECSVIESFSAPASLKSIGNYAFERCTSLKEVSLNEGLTEIGENVFSHCHLIREIVFPDSVQSIGLLTDMPNLLKVTLGKNLSSLPQNRLFDNCQKICEVYDRSSSGLGNTIHNYYFSLPLNYYTDNEGASRLSNVDGYIFLDGSDGEGYLMAYVGNDENLILPSDFCGKDYTVWMYALARLDAVKSIRFSAGVKEIKNRAIAFSPNITELTVDVNNPVFISKGNCVIKKDRKTVYLGCKTSTIPTSPDVVEMLYADAFYGCLGLTSITVPSNITSTVTYGVFEMCTNLTYAYVDSNRVSQTMFKDCTSLKEVRLSEKVEEISHTAFYGCTSLEKINLPSSLVQIDNNAFTYCDKLLKYDEYGCAYVDNWLLSVQTGENAKEHVVIRQGTIGIAADAFSSHRSMTSISLPSGLKYIGDYAFASCKSIKSITLPDSVIKIGRQAFSDCSELEEINIPKGIDAFVGEWEWFAGCPKIKKNVDGIIYIDTWVVGSDSDITVANIREGTVGIMDGAFADRTNLVSVTLPKSLKYIYYRAFYGCANLTEITLHEGLLELHSHCFSGTSISEIMLPKSITFADGLFSSSESEHRIYYQGSRQEFSQKITGDPAGYGTPTILYYYSYTKPTDTYYDYWYYLGNAPTPWEKD